MKLMIASDIHGSAFYCEKMVEAFHREQADKLLLLGDLLYHGPRNDLPEEYAPKRVISMLNELAPSIICVRGNCDAEVDQMVLDFPILSDSCLLFWNGRTIFATHGHIFNEENLNPGSVSIPKENTPHGYMVLDETTAYWKDIDGECYRSISLK